MISSILNNICIFRIKLFRNNCMEKGKKNYFYLLNENKISKKILKNSKNNVLEDCFHVFYIFMFIY